MAQRQEAEPPGPVPVPPRDARDDPVPEAHGRASFGLPDEEGDDMHRRSSIAIVCALAIVVAPAAAQRTAKPQLYARHWMAITGKPLSATAGAMMPTPPGFPRRSNTMASHERRSRSAPRIASIIGGRNTLNRR